MKKKDLKEAIKPIVKECIEESLREGVLSSIISEVVSGVVMSEAFRPQQTGTLHSEELEKIRKDKLRLKEERMEAARQEKIKRLNERGRASELPSFIKDNPLFKGTTPLQEASAASPVGLDPSEAGVPLHMIPGGIAGKDYSEIFKKKKEE